jgi:hypothetical protein
LKCCKLCGVSKELTAFYNCKNNADGKATACSDCTKAGLRERYRKNPEKYKARASKYFRENREHCVERSRVYARTKGWASTLLVHARKSARKRGWDCDIDTAWIADLWRRQRGLCFWYQIEMVPSNTTYRNPFQPSLDRIDCSRGYTKDNVVLTCMAANMGRNCTPPNEFSAFAQQLAKNFRRAPTPPDSVTG